MPQYTLIYFDARGRAELTRWIFAYGGINYVDDRIKKEDWLERKNVVFTGKVPVLMVDDKALPQSLAIARYAAKLTGLVPEDNYDAAMCDSVSNTLSDVTGESYKIWFSGKSEEEKKQEFEDSFYPNIKKSFLERLDKILTGREWFQTDNMTWADLHISLVFGIMLKKSPEKLEQYPAVLALTRKVREIPSIKKWIETSPQTPF
ncbi:Hematopoietic prostaglandin D synthase [Chionoecetes opilio]|uniref:glutathione transferase n=1 Tax=Chionoecetes opilio TaxID=41210 RepID=A0A8J5D0R5_CHIOP|nr:Hematopoietic prostaglandin D synthase [Chionoecetes opilio]